MVKTLEFLLLIGLLLVTLSPALTGCGAKIEPFKQSSKKLTEIRAKQEKLEQKPKKRIQRIPTTADLKQKAQFNATNTMVFNENNFNWYFTKEARLSETLIVFNVWDDSENFYRFVDVTSSVLSEQNYNNFLAIEKTGVCPAPFLNSATSLQLFIAHNPTVIKTLNNSKRGERLNIKGFTLNFKGYFGQHPVPLTIPPKAKFIFVESVKKG